MKLCVNTERPYEVVIESGILDRVGEEIGKAHPAGTKVLLISETNVFPLYGEKVTASLKKAGFETYVYIFQAGEASKQIATVCKMYEALAEHGFTRTDFIVTLGGGVAGDMGGFAAATFLRGISFYQIPTSLLAQVDASVGGKTGVDLPFGKNLVGAFHQPSGVFTDPESLRTLPERYFNDGMGEVIKYGCISEPALFEALEGGTALQSLEEVLICCVKSKIALVETDATDHGRRMILNFGHTFGHALEKLHGFRDLSHGEAVGIGMRIVTELGERMGVTRPGTASKITAVLQKYHLPTEDEFAGEALIEATLLDKKSDGDKLNLILLTDIGDAVIRSVHREDILPLL